MVLETILGGRRFPSILEDAQPRMGRLHGLRCWMSAGSTSNSQGLAPLSPPKAHLVGRCWLALARGRYGTPAGSSHAGGGGGSAPTNSSERQAKRCRNARM